LTVAQHFPCCIRSARIGVGACGVASRPGLSARRNVPRRASRRGQEARRLIRRYKQCDLV
jgi:hypothetical protein